MRIDCAELDRHHPLSSTTKLTEWSSDKELKPITASFIGLAEFEQEKGYSQLDHCSTFTRCRLFPSRACQSPVKGITPIAVNFKLYEKMVIGGPHFAGPRRGGLIPIFTHK